MGNCYTDIRDEFDLTSYEGIQSSLKRKPTRRDSLEFSFNSNLEKTLDCSAAHLEKHQKKLEKTQNPPLTKSDVSLLIQTLSSEFALKTPPESLLHHFQLIKLSQNQKILLQNQIGYIWVIQQGSVQLKNSANSLKTLQKGESFSSCSGSYTEALVLEPSKFWVLDQASIFPQKAENCEKSDNLRFVMNSHLFRNLTDEEKTSLLEKFTSVRYVEGEIIVKEQQNGDLLFFIKEGSVVCQSPGKFERYMFAGEYFGELAPLYHTARTCTVTAVGTVKCLVISKNELKSILGPKFNHIVYRNPIRMALEQSPYLKDLEYAQLKTLIQKLEVLSYNSSLVIPKGTLTSESLYILLNGKLKDEHGRIFFPLTIFGDATVLNGCQSVYNEISAVGSVKIAYIHKSALLPILQSRTEKSDLKKTLEKIYLFRSLTKKKLEKIQENFRVVETCLGSTIFEQGSEGEEFFIVKSGKVGVYINGNLIRIVEELDYFGERALMFDELRSASVRALTQVQCWVLSKVDFIQLIDERVLSVLHKRIQLQDTNVELRDLVVVKKLGEGEIGDVFLAKSEKNHQFYALKIIEKERVCSAEIQNNLIQERKILMELDHCFIPKLVKTFKDDKRIYFLLEYVKGEDLFDVLRKLNLLSTKTAKFYTCCLIITLDYLHSKKILYRDLKPENIIIDEIGYPKLIDFGTAKVFQNRTYTFIGTPYYIAPEIITGQGYDQNVDLWSLGIILYEFLFGEVPFGENETDSYKILEKIVNSKLSFPTNVHIENEVGNFIEQLLQKDPKMRRGDFGLKQNEWIKDTDWEAMTERRFKAPYLPKNEEVAWDSEKFTNVLKSSQSGLVSSGRCWDYEF